MDKKIKIATVFSGIGAAEQALKQMGRVERKRRFARFRYRGLFCRRVVVEIRRLSRRRIEHGQYI